MQIAIQKQTIMDDTNFLDYYHGGEEPFSYGGVNTVQESTNKRRKDISNLLSGSDIYTEYRQFKKPKKTPVIRTYGANYLWEADLMFFTHPDFVKENEGYLYILAFIDTFTKEVGLVKTKSKNSKTITEKMKRKFEHNKPRYLRVDGGGEFVSHTFTKMCKQFDVKMYIAQEPIKCAFIERFNRTFRRILVQVMEFNNSIKWIDHVQTALNIYMSRKHSSIGMSPNQAREEKNQSLIYEKHLQKHLKDNKIKQEKDLRSSKFKKGQFVKLFKKKNIFTRGYDKNVTREYFVIYHVDRRLSKDRYYLKDLKGEKIIGSFYEEYLVRFIPPVEGQEYKLDPNFKVKRKNIRGVPHIWVKWLGWPEKFNQWVPLKNYRHLISDV